MGTEHIKIIWQDKYYAIMDKPESLIIHKSIFSSDRETLIKRLYEQFENPPLPVHRLDRPVSGLLVTAFHSEAASRMSTLFREGNIQKTYLAIVRGYCPEEGVIERPLKNHDTGEMKDSSTRYKCLKKAELPIPSRLFPTSRFSLVEVKPKTGRFHQIRRHLAGEGYPIVGDTSHGDTFCNHHFSENFDIQGLLLHASALEFEHPYTNEKMVINSGLPQRFQNAFHHFGWSVP